MEKSPAIKKSKPPFTRARIEKLIRARSRTSPELILEAARWAGNQGWFFLALRLLEGDPRNQRARFVGFDRKWLVAQSRAALGDFKGALEALKLDPDATELQVRRKKAFELILHLSVSDWEQAIAVGGELVKNAAPGIRPYEKIRGEILYAVSLLHGRQDFEGCLRLLKEAGDGLSTSEFPPVDKRALQRQLELFWGQCEYLRGNLDEAMRIWRGALAAEVKLMESDPGTGVYQRLFSLWLALAEWVRANKSGAGKLEKHQKQYDHCLAELCKVDTSAVSEQVEGYAAVAFQDVSLARQLWLAGAYPGYRLWFEKHFGERLFQSDEDLRISILPPSVGRSQLRSHVRQFDMEVDAWTGQVRKAGVLAGKGLRIKPGQAQQRLFEALVLARYTGLNAFELHRRVFPDERFNPRTSPAKMRTLVYRFRQELRRASIGLKIVEVDERYGIQAEKPMLVSVRWVTSSGIQRAARPTYRPGESAGQSAENIDDSMLQQVYRQIVLLEREFGVEAFSAAQALVVLGLKRSRATEVLSSGVKHGWLKRAHANRKVVYICQISK